MFKLKTYPYYPLIFLPSTQVWYVYNWEKINQTLHWDNKQRMNKYITVKKFHTHLQVTGPVGLSLYRGAVGRSRVAVYTIVGKVAEDRSSWRGNQHRYP